MSAPSLFLILYIKCNVGAKYEDHGETPHWFVAAVRRAYDYVFAELSPYVHCELAVEKDKLIKYGGIGELNGLRRAIQYFSEPLVSINANEVDNVVVCGRNFIGSDYLAYRLPVSEQQFELFAGILEVLVTREFPFRRSVLDIFWAPSTPTLDAFYCTELTVIVLQELGIISGLNPREIPTAMLLDYCERTGCKSYISSTLQRKIVTG